MISKNISRRNVDEFFEYMYVKDNYQKGCIKGDLDSIKFYLSKFYNLLTDNDINNGFYYCKENKIEDEFIKILLKTKNYDNVFIVKLLKKNNIEYKKYIDILR